MKQITSTSEPVIEIRFDSYGSQLKSVVFNRLTIVLGTIVNISGDTKLSLELQFTHYTAYTTMHFKREVTIIENTFTSYLFLKCSAAVKVILITLSIAIC